ncbi:mCG115063, isoform CRA_d, partial [Mus musculus]
PFNPFDCSCSFGREYIKSFQKLPEVFLLLSGMKCDMLASYLAFKVTGYK